MCAISTTPHIPSHPVTSPGPKWSPDGSMLAFSNDGMLSVVAINESGERVGNVQIVAPTGMIDVFNQNILWLPTIKSG